jgi:hypothetical protein
MLLLVHALVSAPVGRGEGMAIWAQEADIFLPIVVAHSIHMIEIER